MPSLEPARWQKQKRLFQKLLSVDPDRRRALLDAARAAEPTLAENVRRMFDAHESDDGAFDEPVHAIQPSDSLVGSDIDGKYRIERRLGRGGMGAVYRAVHLWTGRKVAVKIIAPEFVRLPEFVERFKREARAAGRLRHPNVVNVTDFGFAKHRDGSLAYLVMEYLDGCSLGDLLAEHEQLPLTFVVEVIEQVCLAIDAAHAHGVLHRDLKPDNVWLEPDGRGGFAAKVLDFGIARLRESSGESHDDGQPRRQPVAANATRPSTVVGLNEQPTVEPELRAPSLVASRDVTLGAIESRTIAPDASRASMVLGTPAYMSPEQCRGEGVDERSDVYGLGIVAYEMLTGRPPFSGDFHDLLIKHGEMPPPALREHRRDLPKEVEAVVASALEKSPQQRPSTAGAFGTAFAVAARGERYLEHEALSQVAQHRVDMWRLRLRSHALFVGLASASICALTAKWTLSSATSPVIFVAWLVPLALLLLGADFGSAASAAILARGRTANSGHIPLEDVSLRLWRTAHRLLAASASGWLRPAEVFAPLAVVVEGVARRQAAERSRTLAALPSSFALVVFIRRLASVLMLMGAMSVAVVVVGVWFDFGESDGLGRMIAVMFGFLVASLVGLGLSGLVLGPAETARAAVYLACRSAMGERLSASASSEFLSLTVPGRRAPRARTRFTAAAIASVCVALVALNYLFVFPHDVAFDEVSTRAERIDNASNAFPNYDAAASSVGDHGFLDADIENELVSYGSGERASLSASSEDVISRSGDALAHLLSGVTRPRYQVSILPSWTRDDWRFLQSGRTLATVVVAAIRKRVDAGRNDEAARLVVALYRFAVDLSDPDESTFSHFAGASCRRDVLGVVRYWMSVGMTSAEEISLARMLVELDRRVPPPSATLRSAQRSARAQLRLWIRDPMNRQVYGGAQQDFWSLFFPGLRARAYPAACSRISSLTDEFARGADAYDFPGVAALERSKEASLRRDARPFSPAESLGMMIADYWLYETPRRVLWAMYEAKANCAATVSLLVADAYRQEHGRWPQSVPEACAAASMDEQVDVATKRPVPSRLEGASFVVWLAGFDGKDDGGIRQYVPDSARQDMGVPDTDMIFRLGARSD